MTAPVLPPRPLMLPIQPPYGYYSPPGPHWSQPSTPCYYNPPPLVAPIHPGAYCTPQYPPPAWVPPMGPPAMRSWRGAGGRGRGRGNGPKRSSEVFDCKTCNKQYKTEDTYRVHVASHVKCSTCDFEGNGKALREHELIHFLPDELKFRSDEDILKWREERKRNYPTAENVAKKKQSLAEKKERGESAVTSLHKYVNRLIGEDGRSKPSHRGGRGRGRGQRGRPFNQRGRHRQWEGPKQDSPAVESSKEGDGNIEGSKEGGENSKATDVVMSAILADCNVLSSNTDGEEMCDVPKERCEEEPSPKKQKVGKSRKWTSRRQQKRAKATAMGIEGVDTRTKPTLLEKLLAPEIRREENALLQCIRHITANDFFTPTQNSQLIVELI